VIASTETCASNAPDIHRRGSICVRPIDDATKACATLVCVELCDVWIAAMSCLRNTVIASIKRRRTGPQRMRLRRAAIVSEGAEQRIDWRSGGPNNVAIAAVGKAGAALLLPIRLLFREVIGQQGPGRFPRC